MPPDQPLGEPARIVGPIQGPTAIGGQSQQRRGGGEGRRPAGMGPIEDHGGLPAEAPQPTGEPVPPDPLVAALDRLRATGERSVDLELARLLRGRREYGAGEAPGPDPAGG
jgi:hypothetical protein